MGSAFSMVFNNEVRVKKTSVDKFSFMASLNFFGSNLGLWPGLGLYQILEWMAGIFLLRSFLNKARLLLYLKLSDHTKNILIGQENEKMKSM